MLLPLVRGFLDIDTDPTRTGTDPAVETGGAFKTGTHAAKTQTHGRTGRMRLAETAHRCAESSACVLS